MKTTKKHSAFTLIKRSLCLVLVMCALLGGAMPSTAAAEGQLKTIKTGSNTGKYQCGSGKNAVTVSIDFGCYGKSCKGPADGCNALLDASFAIIRVLSAGVGVVVVASVVVAGIQYSASRGDPNATGKAKSRLSNTMIALLIFLFGYAILNYIIPAGFFK